jgi:peptide/nickel transport system permease protein
MTDAAIAAALQGDRPPRPPPSSPPRRTMVGIVVGATVRRVSARIGLVWLALVAVCAVFGPFIANSYPLVMRTTDGVTHYPLLRYLGRIDVALMVMTGVAVVLLLLRRVSGSLRMLVFISALVATIIGVRWFIHPPERETLTEYRELAAEGRIDWAVRTPIPYSPRDRQRDLGDRRYIAPSITGSHLMGTEANGADVASRMIHACRIALSIGFIATGIALVIGVIVGGLMGYFSGIVDLLGMRVVEIFAAIPTLFLLLTLIAVMPPEANPYRLYVMMIIIGATSWVGYARFVRAEFLKLRKQDFVQAAIATGLPLHRVLFRHILPNGVAPVLVEASFGVAGAIIAESSLSFLGLGLVDEPSWGQMLSESISSTGGFKWWMAIFPGGAIFLTVFAYNLIGEALRDAIDPHTQRATHL